jgi:broad specificity phosphatase PhoE
MPDFRLLLLSTLVAVLSIQVALLPALSAAQPLTFRPAWVDNLRWGGYVIVLRQGATAYDNESTGSTSHENISGEYRLTEQGLVQTQSVGKGLRRLGIPVASVLTSTIQGAVDTGVLLGLGEVTTMPDLAEGGDKSSWQEQDRRAQALRALVGSRPPGDNNLVIVTDKPNIVNAFGQDWSDVHEGEASVFEPDGSGGYKLIVRILPGEWVKLLGGAN